MNELKNLALSKTMKLSIIISQPPNPMDSDHPVTKNFQSHHHAKSGKNAKKRRLETPEKSNLPPIITDLDADSDLDSSSTTETKNSEHPPPICIRQKSLWPSIHSYLAEQDISYRRAEQQIPLILLEYFLTLSKIFVY